MKAYAVTFAAIVMALTLMSGLIKLNVQHHLNIPPELDFAVVSESYQFSLRHPFYVTTYDINLKNEIKGSNTLLHIVQALQNAKPGDTVVFHLVGVGGQVDSVLLLINNIKLSKAYVIMSVEGPVYSGHAYLATYGDELKMSTYSFLMFHSSTIVNLDCSKETGYDRGVSNVEHCEAYKQANLRISTEFVLDVPLLTQFEKLQILTGHDVYIYPEDLPRTR